MSSSTESPKPSTTSSSPRLIAVVDADSIAYSSSCSVERLFEGETGQHVRDALEDDIASTVDAIQEIAGATEIVLCLGGGRNFRHFVNPDYKANRRGRPRPHYLKFARNIVLPRLGRVVKCRGVEADDVATMLATGPLQGRAVLCSIDKDLRQVPGRHLDWTKEMEPVEIDEETAWRAFVIQWLAGDSTDNIKGIPRIGVRKAEKWYDALPKIAEDLDVIRFYTEKGLTEQYAWEQRDLVRLLRWGDLCPLTGKPISLRSQPGPWT